MRDLESLDTYSFCGHRAIMVHGHNDWQDTEAVLRFFGEKILVVRQRYRAFIQKGIASGKRKDLTGGV